MKKGTKKTNKKIVKRISNDIEFSDIGIFIQCIMLPILLMLTFITLLLPEMEILTEFVLAVMLFVMGYNNYRIFKRKRFTAVYVFGGVAVVCLSLLLALNVA